MKYGSNFEGAVVKYEPWAEMPVAQKIWTIIMKRKHGVRWMNKSEFNRFKRKVFLSYTFKDYEKIALVNSKLGDLGFDIFTNFDSANIGDNIVRNFNKQIDECDCFVFVVAEKIQEMSIEEYDLALKRGKPIFVFIKSELFNGEIKKRFGNRLVTLWDDENELVYRIIEEISRYVYRYPLRGYQFEYIVEKIFKEYGCLTKMSNGNENYDILAEKEELKFYIEAKAVRQRVISASVIAKVLISASILEDTYNSKYILVVANELSSQAWEVLEHKKEILVVDIRNLLYIVQYDEVLKSQLLSILEYSTEDIEPKEPIELSHEPPALLVVCCWPYGADVTFPPKGGLANHCLVILPPKGGSINHYLVTGSRLKAAFLFILHVVSLVLFTDVFLYCFLIYVAYRFTIVSSCPKMPAVFLAVFRMPVKYHQCTLPLDPPYRL